MEIEVGRTIIAFLVVMAVTSTCDSIHIHKERKRAISWCEKMASTQGWFRCKNHKAPYCISPLLRCNREAECSDESDEIGCSRVAPSANHRSSSTMCKGCTELERRMLELHNELRAQEKAANMNELQWSRTAAKKAKLWAKKCQEPSFGDKPHGMMSPDYGQNVARNYRTGSIHVSYVLDDIHAWYAEKGAYNYKVNSCSTGAQCGHYKTITSAYVRELGCAVHYCKREMDGMKTKFWNVVCDYRPWPNWKIWQMHPKQPFIEGERCSVCQPGLKCRNNLCA